MSMHYRETSRSVVLFYSVGGKNRTSVGPRSLLPYLIQEAEKCGGAVEEITLKDLPASTEVDGEPHLHLVRN